MQQEASDMQYSDLLEADTYYINLDPTRRSKETATIRSFQPFQKSYQSVSSYEKKTFHYLT